MVTSCSFTVAVVVEVNKRNQNRSNPKKTQKPVSLELNRRFENRFKPNRFRVKPV